MSDLDAALARCGALDEDVLSGPWSFHGRQMEVRYALYRTLEDAQNVENARLFQNFIMDPENAALISSFAKYASGIMGSERYLPADMQAAPELTLPEGHKGVFLEACPPEVNKMMTRIWTEIQK